MFEIGHKYRSFRAHHRYSYPVLFTLLGCGKTLVQFACVFAIAWYGLPMMLGQQNKQSSVATVENNAVIESAVAGDSNDSGAAVGLLGSVTLDQIEIPAVAVVETVTERSQPRRETAKPGVYNADWLLSQQSGSFVVQLASSTDKSAMYQRAFDYTESHPSVVFPFRKARGNRMMYGFAMGIFSTEEDARDMVETLDATAVREGVWIRQMGEVQRKIGGLK